MYPNECILIHSECTRILIHSEIRIQHDTREIHQSGYIHQDTLHKYRCIQLSTCAHSRLAERSVSLRGLFLPWYTLFPSFPFHPTVPPSTTVSYNCTSITVLFSLFLVLRSEMHASPVIYMRSWITREENRFQSAGLGTWAFSGRDSSGSARSSEPRWPGSAATVGSSGSTRADAYHLGIHAFGH